MSNDNEKPSAKPSKFNVQFVHNFQSDDVQVIRTRYPAMKHDSGDVIQPGDCVLLRAGSKKNELPYVAKVASLWENPEDGNAERGKQCRTGR